MSLYEPKEELEKRHKKLSKELINCITKEMAIQRELNLIEYKIDLADYYNNYWNTEKAIIINNQEEK